MPRQHQRFPRGCPGTAAALLCFFFGGGEVGTHKESELDLNIFF